MTEAIQRESPSPAGAIRLPTIVCSSVVRSVHQGESHGGVYLVDLERGDTTQVLDWADANIDWEGRGGDRGLRGIAFHDGLTYLAASDEIFVYDRDFELRGSIRNPYLKHCHEITVSNGRLYMASTGFDSVLEMDLAAQTFTRAWCLRYSDVWKLRRTLKLRIKPSFRRYDPSGSVGPRPADTSHVNNVVVRDGEIYACGTRLAALWRIDGTRLQSFARTPFGTHNTRPFRDGVLFNHTKTDRIAYASRDGKVLRSVSLPTYRLDALEHADLPSDLARPTFGRGLTVLDDHLIVGGSSPATVAVYDIDAEQMVRSVNITMDVRNAVHGLEVWPDEPSTDQGSD
ncbi:MAG: hypothetical protein OEV60_00780 [Actinomycetota bacterium]|nr:hypothetical protein [Actinomycetota bacterium]MDH5223576.1 hypothetical protein [Actinomycetota bacterium]MDH5312952.1 hypothetical protein [Actinomycetota bacterium]